MLAVFYLKWEQKYLRLSLSQLCIFNWAINSALLWFRMLFLFSNRTVSSLMRAEIYYPISKFYVSLLVCCFSCFLVMHTTPFPHLFIVAFPQALTLCCSLMPVPFSPSP